MLMVNLLENLYPYHGRLPDKRVVHYLTRGMAMLTRNGILCVHAVDRLTKGGYAYKEWHVMITCDG